MRSPCSVEASSALVSCSISPSSKPWFQAWLPMRAACQEGAGWPGAASVIGTWSWHQGPPAPGDWTGPTKRPDGVSVCQKKGHTRDIRCPCKRTIGHRTDTVWVTQKHILSLASQDHKGLMAALASARGIRCQVSVTHLHGESVRKKRVSSCQCFLHSPSALHISECPCQFLA